MVLAVVVVVEGRVVVREAVVEGVVRVAGVVVDELGLLTGLLAVVAVRDAVVDGDAFDPTVLDLRSTVDEVFGGARVEVVPAMDIRFAVPEIPRFSSPEGLSSAELLIDGRER